MLNNGVSFLPDELERRLPRVNKKSKPNVVFHVPEKITEAVLVSEIKEVSADVVFGLEQESKKQAKGKFIVVKSLSNVFSVPINLLSRPLDLLSVKRGFFAKRWRALILAVSILILAIIWLFVWWVK